MMHGFFKVTLGLGVVALLAWVVPACSSDDSSGGGGKAGAGGGGTGGGGTDGGGTGGGGTGGTAGSSTGGTAGSSTGGSAGAGGTPTGCNALTNVGSVVQQLYVATDAIVGDGGTIQAGTYVLTAATVYTGPDGGTGPTGLSLTDTVALLDGGAYERVLSAVNDAGLDGSPMRQSGNFVLEDGGGIQVNQTCPAGFQPFTSYDSDGTKLHIYAPAAGLNPAVMFEYTKQ